jgi:hypothetical protein
MNIKNEQSNNNYLFCNPSSINGCVLAKESVAFSLTALLQNHQIVLQRVVFCVLKSCASKNKTIHMSVCNNQCFNSVFLWVMLLAEYKCFQAFRFATVIISVSVD